MKKPPSDQNRVVALGAFLLLFSPRHLPEGQFLYFFVFCLLVVVARHEMSEAQKQAFLSSFVAAMQPTLLVGVICSLALTLIAASFFGWPHRDLSDIANPTPGTIRWLYFAWLLGWSPAFVALPIILRRHQAATVAPVPSR